MRLDHLVHEIRWSNGTQVVQPHASGPSGPAASRHARRRPTMRDAPSGRSGSGGAGTAPAPPGPPPTTGPPIPPRPTPPGAPGDDPGGPSRPAPRPSALDNPSYHTLGTHSEPLPEQPSQYRLPEIRPDARRITFRGSREEPLIFRAFIRRFSRPGTSLQQIWTRPRPGPPQEPHAHRLRARPFPPRSRSGPADHNS